MAKREVQTITAKDVSEMSADELLNGSTGEPGEGLPDFSQWEEEQIGFAPYWNPEPGRWFYGRVIARDERDPEFVRYLIQSGRNEQCKRGADENAENVVVKAGDTFTISVYYSLQQVFDFYLETGIRPYMKVIADKKVKTKTSGQMVWLWKVLIDPKVKAQLMTARADKARQLAVSAEQAKQLSAKSDTADVTS